MTNDPIIAGIRRAIGSEDGLAGAAYRDALESVAIALQSQGVGSGVIGEAIATALDAYANNDLCFESLPGTPYAYTVIGFYEDTNQLFFEHVYARSALHAFAVAAHGNSNGNLAFTASMPGHLSESDGLTCPGDDSVVYASTVLEQPEVFGDPTDVPEAPAVVIAPEHDTPRG